MKGDFSKQAHTTKWIPVKNLSVVWAGAQRELDERHAQHIADNFDPDMFGTLAVTLPNGNGIYHVIDGQHRKAAVQGLWGDEEKVPCNVFDANSPDRAAQIFDKINTHRKGPRPIDAFKVRVTAGNEVEVAVTAIVEGLGYKISSDHSDGMVAAVGALTGVYRSFGPETLKNTLKILQATWGMDRNAVVASIIRGYGAFLAQYGNKANWQRLVNNVQKRFTPGQFLGAVRSARDFRRGSTADAVTYVLLTTHNHGLKKGQIAE